MNIEFNRSNLNSMCLASYPDSTEITQDIEVDEEISNELVKRTKFLQLEESEIPIEIIEGIFHYIHDNVTKASILETCWQFYQIGSRIFKIQDEDGTFPVVELQMMRGAKGIPVLSKLLVGSSIPVRYKERVILPWAIRYRHFKIQRLILKDSQLNPLAREGLILKLACQRSDIETVKLLLNHPKLNEKIDGKIGGKALLNACKYGQDEIVKLLLADKRFNLSDHVANAFIEACKYGHLEVVKLFLEDSRFQRHEQLLIEALKVAGKNCSLEVIKILLEHLNNFGQQDDKFYKKILDIARTEYDYFSHKKASKKFNLTALKLNPKIYPSSIEHLMQSEQGVLPAAIKLMENASLDYKQFVLLPWACRKGNVEVVKALLEDPEMKKGFQTLKWASKLGHIEVVKSILGNAKEEEILLPRNSYPALNEASKQGYTEIVKFILETYSKYSLPSHFFDSTLSCLVKACKNGQQEVVKALINDPRIHLSDVIEEVMIGASKNGHLEVVKVLLADKSIKPSVATNMAMIGASENGHLEVVKVLLADKRVDPSAQNCKAMILASRNGHLEVVKVLLADERVDPSTQNCKALFKAKKNGHLEVVEALLRDPRVNSSMANNYLLLACKEGYIGVVKVLLGDLSDSEKAMNELPTLQDPEFFKFFTSLRLYISANKDRAIQAAKEKGHREIVEILSGHLN